MAEKMKHDYDVKEIESQEKKYTSKRSQRQKNDDAALIPIEDIIVYQKKSDLNNYLIFYFTMII